MKKTLLLLLTLITFSLKAQENDTTAKIDALFAWSHNEMPGVAVAVSIDGRVIYNKAFGLSNLEYQVPNTTATLFEAGSVSKQFVAAGILLLAQEGRLSLEDDVRKYIPELREYEAPITIDMLLSHTSGVKDWGALYSLTGWPRTTRVYTQELGWDIIFKQSGLNFYPGSQYSYSNSNYMLLVLIIERVSGKTMARFTAEAFFEPLGMTSTCWRDNHRAVVPGRSTAYTSRNGVYLLNMPFEDLHGPGGLLTTTADLLRWNNLFRNHLIFNKEYASDRITERKLNDGQGTGYAAGLTIDKVYGYEQIAHSGYTAGYRAWLAWYPQKQLSVVILSNYAQFNPVDCGRQVAAIFLDQEPHQQPALVPQQETRAPQQVVAAVEQGKILKKQEADLSEYAGNYYSPDIETIYRLFVQNAQLKVRRRAEDVFTLQHLSGDCFISEENGEFQFIRNRKGRVTGFKVSVSRAANVPFNLLPAGFHL
ncbi:MAG TPA: serine hydrolase [Bacteroidales bacterium]|jgi:CubicO group peptidase (beta-lactamase class C family)|nr:MAG: Penicillin-binding protein 4* [Bacteroidetes bacterium ADurb.Bin013]HNR28184.1 serine hydrolase [Bacteroidales bacterium]HNT48500.1 serine hydrolase [Bacteroidales bacterium]HOG25332.1 serine hydrolase [Bacteroidales bacterium]HOR11554.1 serine hydrolase [Bacteroidales bacterium]